MIPAGLGDGLDRKKKERRVDSHIYRDVYISEMSSVEDDSCTHVAIGTK